MAVVPTMADSNRCDARPIPLECMLCPKRPKFSDVSHLLTHVSSKSHLHNKFNAEFAAKTEPGTKEALRQYDMWYKQYGIEALLAERLAAKDQKRGGGRRGRQPAASVSCNLFSEDIYGTNDVRLTGTLQLNTTRSRAAASYTEPIKPDPDHGYVAPIPVTPIMAHWGIVGGGGSLHLHEARQDTYFDESVYHTPVKRGRSPYSFVDPIEEAYPVKYASSRSEAETNDSAVPSEASTALTEIPEEEGQNSRLKGTVWPGMALFDSATPEQKRKRNQRKDSSVLEQMKLTSQAVSATECIWTPDGQFQRARDIYASPSIEGSPVATPTRKRKYQPRRRSPTHTETDKSTKNDRSEDQKKTRARRVPLADLTNVRQTRATTRNAGTVRKHGNAKRSDSSAVAKVADMDDVKISVASHDHRDGFDIFRDAPDAAIGECQLARLLAVAARRLTSIPPRSRWKPARRDAGKQQVG